MYSYYSSRYLCTWDLGEGIAPDDPKYSRPPHDSLMLLDYVIACSPQINFKQYTTQCCIDSASLSLSMSRTVYLGYMPCIYYYKVCMLSSVAASLARYVL